jgi:uncharacterized protein YbgA (DUF1722 family)/uncharacterized protein YbbK (DUF523 family)
MMTAEGPGDARDEIRIGVSSCLLGQNVRFDGGHKRDAFLMGSFARFVTWVPVCPEVELGLGTPRDTIRLERRPEGVRLVQPKTGADLTEAMRAWAARRVAALEREDLCGYVLKKDSPSCGLERVRVYDAHAVPARTGRGLFAEALRARFPHLPLEEEGRLGDAKLRENFVEGVFAYRRLKTFFAGRWTVGGLVRFHTAQKLLVLAHSPEAYRLLGRLVAQARALPRAEVRARYEAGLMEALAVPATPRKHANVLQHMLGHLSERLSPEERQEVLGHVEDHRRGLVPLLVPLTLVRHHARRLRALYLLDQAYLDPHPKELMLRNHV